MHGSRRHVGETGQPGLASAGLFLGPVGSGWGLLGPTCACDAGEVTTMPKLFAARVMICAAVFAIGVLAGAGIAAWLVPPA
jgi:hypothetical protein